MIDIGVFSIIFIVKSPKHMAYSEEEKDVPLFYYQRSN